MNAADGNPTLTLRFRGKWAIVGVAVLLAIFILPRFLFGAPSPAEVEEAVRGWYIREATAAYAAGRPEGATGLDRDAAAELARRLDEIKSMRFTSVRVKRPWFAPPFSRTSRFYAEVRREGAPAPEYYRIRTAIANPMAAFWWHLAL